MTSLAPARGDVFFVKIKTGVGSEQHGDRYGIIVQVDSLNTALSTVVVVPTTKNLRRRGAPSIVFLPANRTGLPEDCVALAHQIRVLERSQLDWFHGRLPEDLMQQVEAAVRFTIGLQ